MLPSVQTQLQSVVKSPKHLGLGNPIRTGDIYVLEKNVFAYQVLLIVITFPHSDK